MHCHKSFLTASGQFLTACKSHCQQHYIVLTVDSSGNENRFMEMNCSTCRHFKHRTDAVNDFGTCRITWCSPTCPACQITGGWPVRGSWCCRKWKPAPSHAPGAYDPATGTQRTATGIVGDGDPLFSPQPARMQSPPDSL
jgi:hypothetical protein